MIDVVKELQTDLLYVGFLMENLTVGCTSAILFQKAIPLSVPDVCETVLEASLGVVGTLLFLYWSKWFAWSNL